MHIDRFLHQRSEKKIQRRETRCFCLMTTKDATMLNKVGRVKGGHTVPMAVCHVTSLTLPCWHPKRSLDFDVWRSSHFFGKRITCLQNDTCHTPNSPVQALICKEKVSHRLSKSRSCDSRYSMQRPSGHVTGGRCHVFDLLWDLHIGFQFSLAIYRRTFCLLTF